MIKVLQERPSVSIPCYHHIQITSQLFLCTIFFFFFTSKHSKISDFQWAWATRSTSYLVFKQPSKWWSSMWTLWSSFTQNWCLWLSGTAGVGGSNSYSKPWIWWYTSKPLIYFMSMLVRVHLNTHLFRVPQCQQPFPTRAGSLALQWPGSAEGFYNSREDYRVKECARSRPRWPNGQSQVLGVKKK